MDWRTIRHNIATSATTRYQNLRRYWKQYLLVGLGMAVAVVLVGLLFTYSQQVAARVADRNDAYYQSLYDEAVAKEDWLSDARPPATSFEFVELLRPLQADVTDLYHTVPQVVGRYKVGEQIRPATDHTFAIVRSIPDTVCVTFNPAGRLKYATGEVVEDSPVILTQPASYSGPELTIWWIRDSCR